MPDLSRDPGRSPEDLAIDDVAGTDSCAEFHVGEVADVAAGTPGMLGQGAQVGIVIDEKRDLEPPADLLQTAESFPAGEHDLREALGVSGIHGARHGGSDPDEPA